jgi:monofunctional biosynthetic peptidoglycan transglycosylase
MRNFCVLNQPLTFPLVVVLLHLAGLLNADSDSPVKMLRNFDASSESSTWSAQNDGVMGGVSIGRADIREGKLHFTGELSLENNGGFAQVYSTTEAAGFSAHKGIRLRVKGDGRVYQFRLQSDARFRGSRIAYGSSFSTQAGQWTEVSLPFSSFNPTYRGQALSGPPLNLSSIRQIAFLLADGVPGSFSLIVDWIGLE